jgi:hypothetical protein
VNKIAFTFDPFELAGIDPPADPKAAAAARKEIADFVLEEVLAACGQGKSPVAGGRWKRSLSPAYKKKKAEFSSALFANMELEGDMLDKLECVEVRGGQLELRIRGKEADKADGHNNHSGRSSLPPREFIPKEGGSFKRDILAGVKAIAREYFEDG